MERQSSKKEMSFTRKVWLAGGILAFIILILLFLNATFGVLLLIIAGALIAIYFRGLSGIIQRKTKWKEGTCLTISIVGTLLLISALFWLIGAEVQNQISELSETLPKTVDHAKAKLNESNLGRKLVEKVSSPETMKQGQKIAGRLFSSTFGMFGDLYVILFLGIFFTVSPRMYTKGIISLIPKAGQEEGETILNKLRANLAKWLKGAFFAMFVVFVLTAIGLLIIGMPMWLALALIAGVLNFIPNFGPLIAMIPAVLVALMQSPTTAIIVASLYIVIQVAESNFITPMVQNRLINIPPALIIISQLLISPLAGGWGLVLAIPLLIIVIVLVQELYIKPRDAQDLKA
jgi:predicted PurR-regulated permease PerM